MSHIILTLLVSGLVASCKRCTAEILSIAAQLYENKSHLERLAVGA